jgi:hypothetical protein
LDFFLARSAFFFAAFFSERVGAGSWDVEVAGDEGDPEDLEDPSSLSLGRRRLVIVVVSKAAAPETRAECMAFVLPHM